MIPTHDVVIAHQVNLAVTRYKFFRRMYYPGQRRFLRWQPVVVCDWVAPAKGEANDGTRWLQVGISRERTDISDGVDAKPTTSDGCDGLLSVLVLTKSNYHL